MSTENAEDQSWETWIGSRLPSLVSRNRILVDGVTAYLSVPADSHAWIVLPDAGDTRVGELARRLTGKGLATMRVGFTDGRESGMLSEKRRGLAGRAAGRGHVVAAT